MVNLKEGKNVVSEFNQEKINGKVERKVILHNNMIEFKMTKEIRKTYKGTKRFWQLHFVFTFNAVVILIYCQGIKKKDFNYWTLSEYALFIDFFSWILDIIKTTIKNKYNKKLHHQEHYIHKNKEGCGITYY